MELTDTEIQLLAQLSRDRGLYAECKGADLDTLQKLGLLQWFDARSSTTPFKQDLRLFLKLHGVDSRIDYAWVAAVENWRGIVGPEVSAKVDAIDEIEWAGIAARSPEVGLAGLSTRGAPAECLTAATAMVAPAARIRLAIESLQAPRRGKPN
jgi:hypothetical protein